MPFKSKAQMRKLAQLVDEGKFSKEKFDEFAKATEEQKKKLPDRVEAKPGGLLRRARRDRK